METLKVNGHDIEVNYAEELEEHLDLFHHMKIRGEKLQACSPFRQENHPSFAVNLENGSWVDSGADTEGQRKGSFISLLAHLKGVSYEDICEYLLDKYTHIMDDIEGLSLSLNLNIEEPVAVLGADKYEKVINKPSQYLFNRGINENVQRYFQLGMNEKETAVAIPWADKLGRIINVKYRSIQGKEFWFSSEGKPIKEHLFGLFAVKQMKKCSTVWLVESEIDCLYLWSLGVPAVAFGGASMSNPQYKLLMNIEAESLVIATDNDSVGHRFAEVLAESFMGVFDCYRLQFPEGKKDVNELTDVESKDLYRMARKLEPTWNN